MLCNTWSTKYTSTVCAPCRQLILRPIVRHKLLTDGVTSGSWSKLLSLGTTTRILEALAVFREYVPRAVWTASTLSISMFSWAPRNIYFAGIHFVCCAGFHSAGHKVSCRNHDLAQRFVLTFQPQALDWSPRVTVQDQISTYYPYTLYILVVVTIPHYFHKQRYIICPQKYVYVFFTLMVGGCS